MDKQETMVILAAIKAAYPNAFKDIDAETTVNVWHRQLSDLNTRLVAAAVDALINTNKFPPAISEIRERVYQITHPGELSADEAWGMTLEAVKNYGHYRQTEGLASLPERVRKVAEWMGWDALCMAETDKIGVERGQFIKLYNARSEREKEHEMLPASLREMIGQISQKLLPR